MEILSPASNMQHIQVAIDHNANAVYGGLTKWNARNKAINFTTDQYNFLIDELHKKNIKFFLTLNILMLDDEIEEVIDFLRNNTLPDSFIVTDMGLIKRLSEEFPQVPLHFSTQFGCHNVDDVNYVESLGGTRSILARELTLEEINLIKNNTNIELECFIWGSQCISFSGLCFFGTIINGGGGNRGKCMITCRDIYSVNDEKGHYMYVPDMDSINIVSKLRDIDCLKIEGRRRNPNEIAKILDKINSNIDSNVNKGYVFGEDILHNGLYEKINSRIKPIMCAKDVKNICNDDICIEFLDSTPIRFSNDYKNQNVMYIGTEIKKSYNVRRKNISLDLLFDNKDLKEVLYVNHNGTGHTFFCQNDQKRNLNIKLLIKEIEDKNSNINIYNTRYKKNKDDSYYISNNMYKEIVDYITKDCLSNNNNDLKNNKFKISKLFVEISDESMIEQLVHDKDVKIIYNISTIKKLKNISSVIEKFDNKIIYKLPLFNWKSEMILKYLEMLSGKDVMFTRLSQIYLTKNVVFNKKYIDYTIYVWNKHALKYLKENGIEEFTASPELSYDTNKRIFENENFQVIIGGKIPMVFTRNCFGHIFDCNGCAKKKELKEIKNEDKNMKFEVICEDDFRMVLNQNPILNDYSKVDVSKNTSFRYITIGQSIDTIKKTILIFKSKNYYNELKKNSEWKNSYECNLLQGKE